MANGVTWFEVAGKDREALKGFYSQLFDWKLSDMEEMPYTGVEASDGGIPGRIGQAPDGHPGHVIFYVSVDDIDAALAKAESLGGKAEMGPMEIPAGQASPTSATRRATLSASGSRLQARDQRLGRRVCHGWDHHPRAPRRELGNGGPIHATRRRGAGP